MIIKLNIMLSIMFSTSHRLARYIQSIIGRSLSSLCVTVLNEDQSKKKASEYIHLIVIQITGIFNVMKAIIWIKMTYKKAHHQMVVGGVV